MQQPSRSVLDRHEATYDITRTGVTATCHCGWTWHSDTLTLAHARHQEHVEPYFWAGEAAS